MEQNYFALFGLANEFSINLPSLARLHQNLLQQVHPDKHTGESAQHERVAVQFSAHINNAFDTLKSPLSRAEHLLLQLGVEANHQNTTISDADFLMEQMGWRESLADIKSSEDCAAFNALQAMVTAYHEQLLQSITESFANLQLPQAKEQVAKLYFVEKMLAELDQAEYDLDI